MTDEWPEWKARAMIAQGKRIRAADAARHEAASLMSRREPTFGPFPGVSSRDLPAASQEAAGIFAEGDAA